MNSEKKKVYEGNFKIQKKFYINLIFSHKVEFLMFTNLPKICR